MKRFRSCIRNRSSHARRGFKKASRLAFNYLEVAYFVHVRIVGVGHLNHFPFAQAIGRIRKGFHHFEVPCTNHHLEGARVEEVTDEHRDTVAPTIVGGGTTTAQIAFVNHIVMHERGGVKKLDRGTQIAVKFAFAQRFRNKHQKRGAHTLAASVDDVFADFFHAGDVACEFTLNDLGDGLHILGNRGKKLFDQNFGVGNRLSVRHNAVRSKKKDCYTVYLRGRG